MRRNRYYIPPKLTKACNSSKVQSDKQNFKSTFKLTHSPSNMKAGASGLVTAGLPTCWLCSAPCSGSVSCSGIFSAPVGSIGFSAFTVVSGETGGLLGGVSFSGISRSGTTCGVCTSSFFCGSSVLLITAFASLN